MLRAGLWIGAVLLALVGVGVWAALSELKTPTMPMQSVDLSTVSAARATKGAETMTKVVVPSDPQERAAQEKAYLETWAAENAERAEQARARAAVWRGCQFSPTAQPASQEVYALQTAAAKWLSAVDPVPQSRVEFFHLFLTNEHYHHVGWEGTVAEVVDTPDGQRIQLLVWPRLNTVYGQVAFTPRMYRETWHRDGKGRLVLEKGESGGGLEVVLVD